MKFNAEPMEKFLKEKNYKYLGWQNSWEDNYPSEYIKCKKALHNVSTADHNRARTEHTVFCDVCKIYYKYDSSD